MRKQIDQPEILDTAMGTLRGSIYKCMLGIVQAYYPGSPPTADIQPAVNDVRIDPILGTRISEPWPVLPKVPIFFTRFGGFVLYCDLQAGNKVLLVSPDLDPSAFRRSGQRSDPVDTRRHGGSYWVAIPGDITDAASAPSTGGLLVLGAAGDFAALATKVDNAVSALVQAVDTHIHPTTSPGSPTGPGFITSPTSTPVFGPVPPQIPTPGSTASARLKIPT